MPPKAVHEKCGCGGFPAMLLVLGFTIALYVTAKNIGRFDHREENCFAKYETAALAFSVTFSGTFSVFDRQKGKG
jgi:hypothetical protein